MIESQSNKFIEFNQNVFDVIDTEEKAYWLGFFYSDAYNGNGGGNIFIFCLKSDDYKHMEKLCDFLDFPKYKINYIELIDEDTGLINYQCTIKIYSDYFCKTLSEKGCPQSNNFIITFPYWLEKSLQCHFIRGYFDSDGHINIYEKTKEWQVSICSTKNVCDNIQKIIKDELNVNSSVSYWSETNNNTWICDISENFHIKTFCDWLYQDATIYLDRKYDKYLSLIEQQNDVHEQYNLHDLIKIFNNTEIKKINAA